MAESEPVKSDDPRSSVSCWRLTACDVMIAPSISGVTGGHFEPQLHVDTLSTSTDLPYWNDEVRLSADRFTAKQHKEVCSQRSAGK